MNLLVSRIDAEGCTEHWVKVPKCAPRYEVLAVRDSLHNLGGQKWSFPCYHARHFQQIHWNKLLCGMYGFTAKSSLLPSKAQSAPNDSYSAIDLGSLLR